MHDDNSSMGPLEATKHTMLSDFTRTNSASPVNVAEEFKKCECEKPENAEKSFTELIPHRQAFYQHSFGGVDYEEETFIFAGSQTWSVPAGITAEKLPCDVQEPNSAASFTIYPSNPNNETPVVEICHDEAATPDLPRRNSSCNLE